MQTDFLSELSMTTKQVEVAGEIMTPSGHALPSGWDSRTLGEIAIITSGGTPSKANESFWMGDIPWLTAKDLKSFRMSDAIDHVSEAGVKAGSRMLPASALVVLVRGMTLLKDVPICILGRPMAFNQDLKGLVIDTRYEPEYIAYALVAQRNSLMSMVDVAGHGTGRLATHELISLEIPLPPPAEQRAIVEILDAADATVRKIQALIEAKAKYKRALAEELLTGRRRFPEFAETGKWQEFVVGDVLTETERPVVWSDDDFYNLLSVRRRSEGLFLRSVTQGKTIKTKQLREVRAGDFLISKMQVVHGAWGTVPAEFDKHHVSGSYICLLAKEPERVYMPFLGYLSSLKTMYSIALQCSHGVHIEKMTFKLSDFLRRKITLPPTLPEQRRIAECLSLLDDEIRLLQKQCEALKRQKQGLMQRLLTGAVRAPGFSLTPQPPLSSE
ncbi:MAG: restriction endonuclease subunit S [Fibrella sp.]|nr:restriction endonuclease subunit S [Armatimonadota bacterium]